MPSSLKQSGLQIISGEDTSLRAGVIRTFAGVIEPFYATTMRLRNAAYDRGVFQTHDLGRPTISIGNITTGGTGKTPVVQWLANQLRSAGYHPAILLRGYGSTATQSSDEADLLDQSLNSNSDLKIPVHADPSRVSGAATVLRSSPETDVFLLDDGFQHRRAKRDFNLVLISATEPFGYGHVLPRGLLREPLSGLGRADAFLITRCSLATPAAVAAIDQFLIDHHPTVPVFQADHRLSGVWYPGNGQTLPIESLAGQKIFLIAGIGDPASFARQVGSIGCKIAGNKWFADHHAFSQADLANIKQAAGDAQIITTEKDWVKMKTLSDVGVVKLEIGFRKVEGATLMQTIQSKIASAKKGRTVEG